MGDTFPLVPRSNAVVTVLLPRQIGEGVKSLGLQSRRYGLDYAVDILHYLSIPESQYPKSLRLQDSGPPGRHR